MTWRPSATAKVVHQNTEITIWDDATWQAKGSASGWVAHADAVVYSGAAGDARITTKMGRSKISHVRSPSGVEYDIRGIAAGTVKAPPR